MNALLDALQHAGALADDSLVQSLTVTRRERVKGGRCVVTMEEYTVDRTPGNDALGEEC